MRKSGLALWTALVLSACGDNRVVLTPDAGPACSDGVDNDGDGLVDYPADPGCESPDSDDEDGIVAAQCDDGRDNDGDGKIDYPNDPGCFAAVADNEVDDCPSGPGCPQCANGIDDDGSGQTDFPNDPGCESAADPFEFAENPNACGAGLMIKQLPPTNTDQGMLDNTSTSQLVPSCGGVADAPAIAYRIHLTEPKVMVANTVGSAVDTVLSVRGPDCTATDAELACNNNLASGNTASRVTVSLPAGNYYLLVSGASTGAVGAYMLEVEFFTGEGEVCGATEECGPGLVCRVPVGQTEMVCAQPVCNDGIDDDADGKVDFPEDPGCLAPDDDDETDDCPSGPNCPACSNEIDDDMDGQTDYPNDPSCSTAGGNSEACSGEQDPILPVATGATTDTLVGASDDHDPSCGGNGGPDRLYTLTVPAMRTLNIDTDGSAFDTVLSVMDASCQEPSLRCDDDSGSGTQSLVTMTNVAPGTYIVAIDAFSNLTTPSTYALNVSGVIAPGGRCDPEVTLGGALACPATNPCIGTPGAMICEPSACGDGTDNDGDGITDFPDDPGCTSLDDIDESDTCANGPGPGCPECADGVDNDNDGQTDYPNDSNCALPSSGSEGCPTTDGLEELTMKDTTGSTSGAVNDVTPPCGSSSHSAPDKTYMLKLPALRNLSIVNTNSFDQAVMLFNSTCGGTPIVCRDEPENVLLNNVAAGTYFYVVDGFGSTSGSYTITVTGTIQNGASCEEPLAQSGALRCGDGFTCKGTVGSRTCQRARCNDGLDNDADGIADYPNDPGCLSDTDDDETDDCPTGPNCPTCSDGEDNDGDMLTDFPDDPSCFTASASSEACPAFDGIEPLVDPTTAGSTTGAIDDWIPTCGNSTTFPAAPDLLYSLDIPDLTTLTITNTNSFDAVVSLFNGSCEGAELACSDEPENLTLMDVAGGTYYYMVDGDGTASGDYTITVSGVIANGASCESALAQSGALTCATGYACAGMLGSRTCQVAQCNNGVDDDGDGKTDYPNEPGCDSPSDNDETDPTTPPVCSNGVDDDGDMLVDFPMDGGCSSAADDLEEYTCSLETDPVVEITATPVTGSTTTATNDFTTSTCQSSAGGRDVTYVLELPVPVDSMTIDLSGSSFDTVLTVRDATCSTSLACDDDGGAGTQSMMTLTNVAAGAYFLVIDGFSTAQGNYTMSIQGTVAAGTACDSPLFGAGILSCPSGTTCTGTPATCQ